MGDGRRPVRPTTLIWRALAAPMAARMLGELPEVEYAKQHVARLAQGLDLAREQALVAVVVADGGEHRAVHGQRDGRQARAVEVEARHQLARDVLAIGGAATVAGQQDLVAAR